MCLLLITMDFDGNDGYCIYPLYLIVALCECLCCCCKDNNAEPYAML